MARIGSPRVPKGKPESPPNRTEVLSLIDRGSVHRQRLCHSVLTIVTNDRGSVTLGQRFCPTTEVLFLVANYRYK